jgi:hypothetical protein
MAYTGDFEDILKEFYDDSISNQLEQSTPLRDAMTASSEGWEGRYKYIPIHVTRNTGLGARSEYGETSGSSTLPTAGKQGYTKATYRARYLYGGVQFTGQTVERVKSGQGGWGDLLAKELSGLEEDLRVDFNRMLWGDGSGSLAVAASNLASVDSGTFAVDSTIYLQEQMQLFAAGDDSTVTITITDIDDENNVVTFTAAEEITVATDATFWRPHSDNLEPDGLSSLVSTSGTIGGIDRSGDGVSFWKAKITNGTGKDISEDIMKQMMHKLTRRAMSRPTEIWMSYEQYRMYAKQALPARRYNVPTNKGDNSFDLGYSDSGFSFDNVPIKLDDFAPEDKVWFLNKKYLLYMVNKPWGWIDRGGDRFEAISGKDGLQGWMGWYGNTGITSGQRLGLIYGLNTS